ncbi:MAG: hypothetical protein OEV00_09790, partial [Acidobacteriota bacterium]|nr:hypothetical protein [Acidobacteriota bacterium]
MKSKTIAMLAVILTLSTASEATPPVPTGPGFLPGDALVEVAPFVQETPVVAAGGSGFLAAWTDLRTDDSFFGNEQGARDIYAARLDATGNLIDTSPIVVNQAFGAQEQPQVSWNGENWLVVWENQTMGASYYETRIFAARVAPDGTVLDDPPIQVVADGSSGLYLAVTNRGTEWLVVGQGFDAGDPGIVGVRVSGQGIVLDPTPVVLVPQTYFLFFNISVHSAQGEYLLTYKASSEFKAQRLQSDLNPIGAAFNIPGLTVGSNGTNYFIVWTSGSTLVGSTMSPDGTLQNPGGVAIMPAVNWEVDVTWDGVNWWVSKMDGFDGLVLARVTTGDVVLDPGGFAYNPAIVDFVREHRIAGGLAGGVQLVWKDDRVGGVGPYDIHGAFVSANAQPGPDAPVSLSSRAQTRPDLAAGPDGFLAVFSSERSGTRRILAQRLDPLGSAIDAEPIEVTSGPNAISPAAAWNGSVFLVVWSDSGEILGRRLLPDGNFLDAVPLSIMPGSSPDVAALGDLFLVAGTDINPGSPHFRFPYAIRVDGSTGNT